MDDIKLDDWVKILCFRDEDLSVERWQEMIEAARKRGSKYAVNGQEILPPFSSLVPVATLSDLRSAIYHPRHHESEEYEDTQAARPVSVEVLDSYNRDIALRDPLRHEALRILPLRDAAEEEQPFWAELLINLGLAKSPRNCMSFLDTWKPINIRSESSKFIIDFHKGFLREFFEDNEFLELKPTLYWINQPSDSNNNCLEIGWYPLLEALRGQRSPLLPELLDELLINAGGLTGELPHTGTPEALELLPGELWALILLIDALARCPWEDFSSSTLGLKIVTYLGLAAAFVRSAYAFALYSSESFDKEGLSLEQRAFIDALEKRDPSYLLQKQEEEILKELANLFSSDDLQQKLSQPEDSLSRAALTYLNSPVYTAVVALVKAQPEVTYSPLTESQSAEAP